MRSGKYYTVFVWWCVLQQTSVLQLRSVYADTKTVVNYGEMETLLVNTNSVVSADGNEVFLNQWLSDVGGEYTTKGEYFNSTVMYKFVKCECAHFVSTFIESIYRSWAAASASVSSSSSDANVKKRIAIPYLISLNVEMKTALTELFAISDEYPNVKSGETHFLKTLLMTSFYVDTFLVPFAANESRGLDETQTLQNMDRVLLQIINLVRQYDIEHCNPGMEKDRDDGGRNVNGQLWEDFRRFLQKITYTTVEDARGMTATYIPRYPPTGLGGIKFENCMRRPVEGGNVVFDLCDFLRNSLITRPDGMQIYIPELFGEVEGSLYDAVEAVYDYLFVIYRVLLKYVYRLTVAFWEVNASSSSSSSLDVGRCQRMIAQLRSMHCPPELIDHLELVLRVERYRNEVGVFDRLRATARETVKTRADKINDVTLSETETGLSLLDLMDALMVDELKQFWWAFNLLHEDQQRKSLEVYENVSLNLFVEASNVQKNEFECIALKEIHPQLFSVLSAIDDCLRPSANIGPEHVSHITFCLSVIRDTGPIGLSNYFLVKLDEWTEGIETVENLRIDLNFMNIFLSAVIGLKKEFNIDKYTAAAEGDHQDLYQKSKLIVGKLQKWKRLIKGIMNVFDNYEIRNCPVLEDRITTLHRGKRDQQAPSHYLLHGINNCNHLKTTASVQTIDQYCTIYESYVIDRKFYSIEYLTDEYSVENSNTLGWDIYFDWYGEIKCMREIFINVSGNMLDIRDLVVYQRLYLRWTLYLFYRAWFAVLREQMILNHQNVRGKEQIHLSAFASLEEFNRIIFEMYGMYGDYCAFEINFYNVMCEADDRRKFAGSDYVDRVETELISSMGRQLGVVREGQIETGDFQIFFHIDPNYWRDIRVFSILLTTMENRLKTINGNFQFLHSVEYTPKNLIDDMDVSDDEEK